MMIRAADRPQTQPNPRHQWRDRSQGGVRRRVDPAHVATFVGTIAAARVRTGSSVVDRDDIFQDAAEGALRAMARFRADRGASPATFARYRGIGHAVDVVRTLARRHAAVPMRGLEDAFEDAIDPADAVARSIVVIDVRRAVARLGAAERHVIDGLYWRSKTLRALGAELNITEARACQIARRARERLGALLGEYAT